MNKPPKGYLYPVRGGRGRRSSGDDGSDINLDDLKLNQLYGIDAPEVGIENEPRFEDNRGFFGRLFRPNSAERFEKMYAIESLMSGDELEREKMLQTFLLDQKSAVDRRNQEIEDEARALAYDSMQRSRSPLNDTESERLDIPLALNNATRGATLRQAYGTGPLLSSISGLDRSIPENQLAGNEARRKDTIGRETFPDSLRTARNVSQGQVLDSSYALDTKKGTGYQDAIGKVLVGELLKKLDRPVSEDSAIFGGDGNTYLGPSKEQDVHQEYITDPKTKQRLPVGDAKVSTRSVAPQVLPKIDRNEAETTYGNKATTAPPTQPVPLLTKNTGELKVSRPPVMRDGTLEAPIAPQMEMISEEERRKSLMRLMQIIAPYIQSY